MKKLLMSIAILLFTHLSYAQISGPTNLEGTQTYSIPSVSGSQYFWSVTGGLNIVSGQGTNSIQVSGTSNGQIGVVRYQENTLPYCDNINVTACQCDLNKPIVQPQTPNWNRQGQACAGEIVELAAFGNNCGLDRYEWIIQGATLLNTYGPHNEYARVRIGRAGLNLLFKTRAIKECGTTLYNYLYGVSISCDEDIIVFPPDMLKEGAKKSSFEVTPTVVNKERVLNVTSSKKQSKIVIYDLNGHEKLSANIIYGKNTINLNKIDKGIYIYRIVDKEGDIVGRIVVE